MRELLGQMNLRSVFVGCAFVVVAIVNGGFRDEVLTPRLGELGGHIIATITLSTAMVVVTYLTISWIRRLLLPGRY